MTSCGSCSPTTRSASAPAADADHLQPAPLERAVQELLEPGIVLDDEDEQALVRLAGS